MMSKESGKMKVMTRDALAAWLDDLARQSILIAPKAVEDQILYKPVAGSAEIVLDFIKTDMSAKEFFLPSTEVLLAIERGKNGFKIDEPSLPEEAVIFGLRPCDARALGVLDALMLEQEPVDPYYAARRERSTLIGLACREMAEDCYCTSFGSSPDDASAVDLMLTEIDQGYAVQVVTEKGDALLGGLALTEVHGSPPSPVLREERLPILEAESWPALFDDAFWGRLADRCLSCRVCTYVCPTCRCFDMRDSETPGRSIERLRTWDSCMAQSYRRIAGGHDSRPAKLQRLRNRFYCKFCYYPQDFGPVACVGCGRCINKCPVNVDIAEVLEGVAAL